MKRNVSVVCVCIRCNILISGKIIKEMSGSVASGTHYNPIERAYATANRDGLIPPFTVPCVRGATVHTPLTPTLHAYHEF